MVGESQRARITFEFASSEAYVLERDVLEQDQVIREATGIADWLRERELGAVTRRWVDQQEGAGPDLAMVVARWAGWP